MGKKSIGKVSACALALALTLALAVLSPVLVFADEGGGLKAGSVVQTQADDIIASGTWGTCPWEISAEGILTVHPGQGVSASSNSPWHDYAGSVSRIVFLAEGGGKVIAPENSNSLFEGMSNVQTINLAGFDTSRAAWMRDMFHGCSSLTSLDLSGINTSGVISMGSMFEGCESLTSLGLFGLDTSAVEDMGAMFKDCSSLASLDLFYLDTSNVWHMGSMFEGCESLTSIDFSDFNTSNVRYMFCMFCFCSSLTSLNLSSFDASAAEDMSYMFDGCPLQILKTGKGFNSNTEDGCEAKFPVKMYDSANGVEYAAGARIPGASYRTFTADKPDSPSTHVCYKLSFNINLPYDGEIVSHRSIEVGEAYGALPKVTRDGFDFLGWFSKDSGGSKVSANTVLTNGKNVTIYAHWKAHKYDIKFKGNGGSGSTKSMTNLECGKKYTLKANKFSRKGYVFSGWSTSDKGAIRYTNKAKVYNASTKNNGTVTLYAVWKKKPASIHYSINYDANGGTGKMSLDKNLAYGKTYKLKKNAFKRSGHTFVGWSTKKGGSVKYRNNEAVRNLTSTDKGTVKLFAVWAKNTDTAKINKEKKNTPKVYGCIISGCNDKENGHTLSGATDVYKKLLKNKIDGYTTESKNIKLVGVGQPAPYKSQIKDYITKSFSATTANDISFVFYAGHGMCSYKGKGLGICTLDDNWNGYYSYSAFLNLLNEKIKGKIVLIVDACFSGGFAEAAKSSPAKNRICVLASSAVNEGSVGTYKAFMATEGAPVWNVLVTAGAIYLDKKTKGDSKYQCFTYTMMKGLNWHKSNSYPADLNGDEVVTCEELYACINSSLPGITAQSPKCYLGKLKDQILFG